MSLSFLAEKHRRSLSLALLGLAALAGFVRVAQQPPPAPFETPLAPALKETVSGAPQTHFVSLEAGPHRHAPSLVELRDGRLRAFWFSGSREGAADVVIRSAVFDPSSSRWSDETTVVDRQQTQSGLLRYVKKLGNAVAIRDDDGRLQLFYVTVSLGGWAGSSITRIVSTDNGASWSAPQRLVTSPFLNLSTLVKGAPFRYADGTIGLPVYHEFIGKFAEILRLDDAGRLLDKQRLTHGRHSLQPVVLVRDGERAQVLMRHAGKGPSRVVGVETTDGGRSWSAPNSLPLANPNAAVSGLTLPDGTLLAVLNDIESNRDALSLVASNDGGQNWKTLEMLEDQRGLRGRSLAAPAYRQALSVLGRAADPALDAASAASLDAFAAGALKPMCVDETRCDFEFSYPYLAQTAQGSVHLVYTWNRSYIRYRVFPLEWLSQRMKEATDVRAR